jgi:hypothetical protein
MKTVKNGGYHPGAYERIKEISGTHRPVAVPYGEMQFFLVAVGHTIRLVDRASHKFILCKI